MQLRQHADGPYPAAVARTAQAEQRVANVVLEQSRPALNESIVEIARLADVSQPTVIRFCVSLGFLGQADFKLKFAGGLTASIPVRHTQVCINDSTCDLFRARSPMDLCHQSCRRQ